MHTRCHRTTASWSWRSDAARLPGYVSGSRPAAAKQRKVEQQNNITRALLIYFDHDYQTTIANCKLQTKLNVKPARLRTCNVNMYIHNTSTNMNDRSPARPRGNQVEDEPTEVRYMYIETHALTHNGGAGRTSSSKDTTERQLSFCQTNRLTRTIHDLDHHDHCLLLAPSPNRSASSRAASALSRFSLSAFRTASCFLHAARSVDN
jgi:hypothetical protein